MENIKVGDLVEERGTDSGAWIVVELYRDTPRNGTAAKLALHGNPQCTTHCPIEKLSRVGPWR